MTNQLFKYGGIILVSCLVITASFFVIEVLKYLVVAVVVAGVAYVVFYWFERFFSRFK